MAAWWGLGLVAQEMLLFELQDAGGHRFTGPPEHVQRGQIGVPIPLQVLLGGRILVGLVKGVAAPKGLQRWTITTRHHVHYI